MFDTDKDHESRISYLEGFQKGQENVNASDYKLHKS